jgi:hypothetical protein
VAGRDGQRALALRRGEDERFDGARLDSVGPSPAPLFERPFAFRQSTRRTLAWVIRLWGQPLTSAS